MPLPRANIKITKPTEGQDLSHIEVLPAEILPSMDEMQTTVEIAGQEWGKVDSEVGKRIKDFTPGERFRMKSEATTIINNARPDLEKDEVDHLATRVIDEIGKQLSTS